MERQNTKGLTATIILQAQSPNYDEGVGNLSIVKKFHRGDGKTYSYISRQSLRYSIFMQGKLEKGWRMSNVVKAAQDKAVLQLSSPIRDCEETDLFGYMLTGFKIGPDNNTTVQEQNEQKAETKTKKGETAIDFTITRTMPVRISPAVSLEPFKADSEMLTNKFQADKYSAQEKVTSEPNIANMEFQRSLFSYTISIDLHRVGSERSEVGTHVSPNKEPKTKADKENFEKWLQNFRSVDIGNPERLKRVSALLDIVKTLYRDIRGRREDLKPLFIIGGVYDICNPYFENLVQVDWVDGKPRIVPEPIISLLDDDKVVTENTYVGIRPGIFANDQLAPKIQSSRVSSPEKMLDNLKLEVAKYYGVNDQPSSS